MIFAAAMSLPPKTVYALVQAVLRDPEVGPCRLMMHAKASSDDTAKHKKCINNAKLMQTQSRKKCTENAKNKSPKDALECQKTQNKCEQNAFVH